jgi:hypothetical protein
MAFTHHSAHTPKLPRGLTGRSGHDPVSHVRLRTSAAPHDRKADISYIGRSGIACLRRIARCRLTYRLTSVAVLLVRLGQFPAEPIARGGMKRKPEWIEKTKKEIDQVLASG